MGSVYRGDGSLGTAAYRGDGSLGTPKSAKSGCAKRTVPPVRCCAKRTVPPVRCCAKRTVPPVRCLTHGVCQEHRHPSAKHMFVIVLIKKECYNRKCDMTASLQMTKGRCA
jgi:hypothetical protein